jgi:hypothetical protein
MILSYNDKHKIQIRINCNESLSLLGKIENVHRGAEFSAEKDIPSDPLT